MSEYPLYVLPHYLHPDAHTRTHRQVRAHTLDICAHTQVRLSVSAADAELEVAEQLPTVTALSVPDTEVTKQTGSKQSVNGIKIFYVNLVS